jgi:hypothetical protein
VVGGIGQFGDLLGTLSVGGLVATGAVLITARRWRLKVLALGLQYLLVVLLLTRVIRVELAAVKGLTGWLICAVFYVTERRVGGAQAAAPFSRKDRPWYRELLSARGWFDLVAAILVSLLAYGVALRFPLPEVSTETTLACYLLAGLGLLLAALNENPFDVGLGLLTALAGFDLFYVGLEPSLAVAGLVGAVGFLIALATAYLRSAQAQWLSEGRAA